jgi:hypothetical protein
MEGKSDFIVGARLASPSPEATSEQLWARPVGPYAFELCCIPFFVYDLALGDLVETDEDYTIRNVTAPSGRYVFRVWFGATSHPRDAVAQHLRDLGALLEWSSVNLLAIDARDQSHAEKIVAYLSSAESRNELVYETGRTS